MKRVLLFIGLPIAVAVAAFVLVAGSDTASDVDTTAVETREQDATTPDVDTDSSPDISVSSFDYPPAPADARMVAIERLADGDSFDIRWLDTGESDEVRLFGLNAPEADACFGNQAREVLQELTDGVELRVESIDRDEFGRVLGNVWADDVLINVRMVELGGALALSDGGRHAGRIQEALAIAQSTNVGLWDPAFCGASETPDVVIIAIEANAPGQDHLNPNGEWIELANLGDSVADLTDWAIRDESTRHRYFFPDGFMLGIGDGVRVFSGCGDDDAQSLYWCDGDPVWNNGGDTGFLVNADGGFADTFSYGG